VPHDRTRQGLKFGHAAHDYDRGRPSWPPAALDAAAAALDLTPSATVVDLGAGTGQLTRLLAERFVQVVAVEPLSQQRELLAAKLPGINVRAGTAERLGLADRSARAVFVAEAFHWFDGRRALAEAARVLEPSGGIVLLWNIPIGRWEPALPDTARRLVNDAILRGGEPGHPLQQRGVWRQAFTGSPFGQLHQEQFEHALELDREGVIANAMSISSIAGLPERERGSLRERLREALAHGTYRQRLRTDLYWARLEHGRAATATH
jgi:SAM-dependent methyltransferase